MRTPSGRERLISALPGVRYKAQDKESRLLLLQALCRQG
jgi:hypothetical protein